MAAGKLIAMLCTAATVVLGVASVAKPVSVQLREGIYLEQIKGDLDQAMDVYERIVFDAEADRRYIAEAYYRLGMCLLKKGQRDQAVEKLQMVVDRYPDQELFAAKAKKELDQIRPEVVKTVQEAVEAISQSAEGDPRVKKAMESLAPLEDEAVLKEVARYLDSSTDTIRRAAIYILWQGEFENIQPAASKLIELCNHPEEFTRGMAGLALGQRRVGESYDELVDLTLNDLSPYARRCGAYALGLLGMPKAEAVLKKAMDDPNELVRNNAEAALEMLKPASERTSTGTAKPAPAKKIRTEQPVVIESTPQTYANDVSPDLKELSVTFDRAMSPGGYSWVTWNAPFPDTTGNAHFDAGQTTCSLPVDLKPGQAYLVGINIGRFQGFKDAAKRNARPFALVFATKDEQGRPTPIPAEMLARAKRVNQQLQQYIQKAERPEMATRAGDPPTDVPVVIESEPATYANDVAAGRKELSVTFNQEMMRGNFSWVTWDAPFPDLVGKPRFTDDGRTCVVDAELKAGQAYLIGINIPPYDSFMNLEGEKARQFVLVFATKDEQGNSTPIPTELLQKAQRVNRQLQEYIEQQQKLQPRSTGSEGDLQARIDAAPVGDTVIVPAGTYEKPLRIAKSLTLKGASRAECIFEVTANEPAVLVDTGGKGEVTLENLTFKWQLATSDRLPEPVSTVRAVDSKLNVNGCAFLPLGNFQRCPTALRADGFSQMHVDRCRFEGYEYTVCFWEGVTGSIRNCLVVDPGHQGITLYAGAKVDIERNVVTGSRYHALRSTGGTIHARENLLIENANRGVYLGSKSAAGVIENNVIWKNATGVDAFASTRVKVSNNLFGGNTYCGVSLRPSARLLIEKNLFVDNERGIILHEPGDTVSSSCGQNGFWKNKTAVENWDGCKDMIEGDPQLVNLSQGDFTVGSQEMAAAGLGPKDPAVFRELWRTWQNREDPDVPFGTEATGRDETAPDPQDDGKAVSPADRTAGEQLAAQGWQLWQQQKFAEAEPLFAQAVAKDPTAANAWNGLGWSRFNLGKPEAAQEAFEQVVRLESNHAAALNGLGWIAKGKGNTEKAIEYWKQAVKAAPGATAALNGLATTYAEQGDYQEAAKYYKAWLDAEPNNEMARKGLEDTKAKL